MTSKVDSVPGERLKGRVAVVTGGSSGIGRATCVALANVGARVVVVGKTAAHVRRTVEEIKHKVKRKIPSLGLTLDVSREQDMSQMADRTLAHFGRIDILVACAGIDKRPRAGRMVPYSVAQLPSEDWDEVLATNLKGTFLSNRAVLPTMIAQRAGSIVNISSSPAGLKGQPFAPAYCASKFGIVGLSESLAAEVRRYGIKVQVLFPDLVDTPLVRSSTLASRFGPPLSAERVADLILHLVSLPDDTVLLSSRRFGCSVLRRVPTEPRQWLR